MTNAELTARVAQVEQQVRDCLADLAKADTSRVNAEARVKTLEDAIDALPHSGGAHSTASWCSTCLLKQALASKEPKA